MTRFSIVLLRCGLLCACAQYAMAVDSAAVRAALTQAGYAPDGVAYLIRQVGTGGHAAAHNADRFMVPASVLKLVTAVAAYELLGYEYVFGTDVYAGGAFDADSGVVDGNLYIRGGGDPGFLAERVWLFTQHLLNRGIRRIAGDVVLDEAMFDATVPAPGFGDDKSSRAYEAPTGALSVNFNSIEIHLRPAATPGLPVQVRIFPPHRELRVYNRARTVAPGRSGQGVSARTESRDGSTVVIVDGEMAVGADARVVYRKAWETAAGFGRVLAALFQECGIAVAGTMVEGRVPDSISRGAPLYRFESLPLSTYVGYLFKYSNNVTAELLFRTMAARHSGVGSWDSGAAVVRQWWRNAGLPGQLQLVNGSGMGSENRMSAEQVLALLDYVRSRELYYPDFLSQLSVAGIDGTLQDRFTRSTLKGQLRAKTGTLNNLGVSSLAGYVLRGGDRWIFAILINDRSRGQFDHWILQEKLIEAAVGR